MGIIIDTKAKEVAQPERLTDDDFETIRIHLNAYKEKLCNQRRWKEAEEYQRIIDRFIAFASTQPEKRTEKRTETHARDLIDRQALLARIDRIVRVNHLDRCKVWFTPAGAKTLVSEQPTVEPEIVRCKDCKHWTADEKEAFEDVINEEPTVEWELAKYSPKVENGSGDLIYRQAAIDALWKALYEYEDKTEKQFQESEDLDVGDWIEHRIFVQNMNDIDRQTILNLPSAQPEPKWIPCGKRLPEDGERVLATHLGGINPDRQVIEHIYENGKFVSGWDMDMNIDSPTFGQRYMGNVIAWMPLPKPYMEEEE